MIAFTLRHYLSRFGWEIAAFWLISLTNTILLGRNGPPGVLRAMAVLEVVAIAWITIRLVLAEDGFKTSGGWQSRPISQKIRLGLPLALAVVVVVFPAILRAFAFQRMFDGAVLWNDFKPGSWWRQVFNWLVFFALPLKLFGLLILQGIEGRARTAAWATLAVVLLPILSSMGVDFGKRTQAYGGTGGYDPRDLAQGIQRELPDAKNFIGPWYDPVNGDEVPAAKLVAKIAIAPDAAPEGAITRSAVASLRDSRVTIRIRALLDDPTLGLRMERSVPIIRYADGTFATCASMSVASPGPPLPFCPASEWEFCGDFISPLSLPEFVGDPQWLTRGLELMFFESDFDRPHMPHDATRVRSSDKEVKFHFAPKTMEELFTQFPWSDETWKDTAWPLLVRDATRADIPFLLERMRLDPRLSAVFFDKGWTVDAIPVLRELAKERLPMGPAVVIALANEKDPTLAGDLAAIALQLNVGLDVVEPMLRAQPGFDWPAYVKELWRRKKYATNWLMPYGEFWQPAFWAAQEGDFTAFRETAEQAARGQKWELERLVELVAGEHGDLIGFVRENLESLRYDPSRRKWGL